MKLSDFELEVMQVVWANQPAVAMDVHRVILGRRPVAYSTVKTIIDRLEGKGALQRVLSSGRNILYKAAISREQLTKPMVHSFINKLFKGNLRPLFNHVLSQEKLTLDDITYLEGMIADRKKDLAHD